MKYATKINCPKCKSSDFAKRGWVERKRNPKPIRQYQCKDCKYRFTTNSLCSTANQNKPELNREIMKLYCEGCTLRGITRILNIPYVTVVRKFRHMAKLARETHLKTLAKNQIQTTYMQFDEMETFVNTRKTPYGIALAIRPKTGEILSAKVCRIPIKALSVSKAVSTEWNSKVNRKQALIDMLIESSYALKKGATLGSDGDSFAGKVVGLVLPENKHQTYSESDSLWRINHTCAKLRHHVSRLKRKTWATSKNWERLQDHLDLFIAYQNGYRI